MNAKKLLSPSLKRAILTLVITPHVIARKLRGQNVHLRWNSSDVNVYYHTFMEKEYSFPFEMTPKNIIDAGANIGLTGLLLAKKYPTARIVCIEPESNNFDLLSRNIAKLDRITALKNGLWSKNACLNIHNPNESHWAFITEETDDRENCDVEAVSVPEIMKRFNMDQIDLLKIDIEGSEKELFSRNTGEWLNKTKLIIMEIHSQEIRDVCEKTLREHGFVHFFSRGENDYYANREYFNEENRQFS